MNETEYLVGVYARLQLSLRERNLLNENGSPKKLKRVPPNETDTLNIYILLSEKIRNVTKAQINLMAEETNKKVQNLVDQDDVNNTLLAVYLIHLYLEDKDKDLFSNLILPKTRRLLAYEGINPAIRRTTSRIADNIYRQFQDRPQVSNEIRDLRWKRVHSAKKKK